MTPLISIVVPIYNLAPYLFQCIHSITNQTYKNLEIILVDDGSTDNALEICEFFRKSDSRIKIITQKNSGLVSARKSGVRMASGDYIFYIDGDDWIDTDCIDQYLKYIHEYDVDLVIGNYKRELLGKFKTIKNHITPGKYTQAEIEKHLIQKIIWDEQITNHGIKTYSWGKLFKANLVKKFQETVPNEIMVGEDAALLYPIIFNSKSIYITNINAYNYRQRSNSILKSINFNTDNEIKKIAIAFQYLASALPEDTKKQLQKYFQSICIIRAGGFIGNNDIYKNLLIFGSIKEKSIISIYNSGSFGQHTYRQIQNNTDYKIKDWFDIDHHENNLTKMSIKPPEFINTCDFDYLLIPSFNQETINEFLSITKKYNLDLEKIRFATLGVKNTNDFINLLGFNSENFSPLK